MAAILFFFVVRLLLGGAGVTANLCHSIVVVSSSNRYSVPSPKPQDESKGN